MANIPAKAPGLFDLRVAPAPRTRLLVGICAVGVVFALWFLATYGSIPEHRWVSPVILPSPVEVAKSFGPLWKERDLLDSIIATLRRVLAGFGLAIAGRRSVGDCRRFLACAGSGGDAGGFVRAQYSGCRSDPIDHSLVRN